MINLLAVIIVIGFIFALIFLLDRRDRRRAVTLSNGAVRTLHSELQQSRRSILDASRLRSYLLGAKWRGGSLLTAVAIAAAVYSAWGPFWPTAPDIVAQDSVDGSSLILPFSISSKNVFFPITTVSVSCYVNLLYVMDADKKTIVMRDSMFSGGTTTVGPGVSYNCDAELLSVKKDGSLIVGFPHGQHLSTAPGAFRGPLSVLKLCVSIVGSYDARFSLGHALTPIMYQWPSVPNGHQWARGGVVFDDEGKWTPPESKVGAAYGLRQVGEGHGALVRGALTCDQLDK